MGKSKLPVSAPLGKGRPPAKASKAIPPSPPSHLDHIASKYGNGVNPDQK